MRELRPELQTLINSGHCIAHSTLDITLTDGEPLFVCTAEIHVNRFGKNQQYLAKIPPEGISELALSIDIEADTLQCQLTNVDTVIGQLLTGSIRRLDGAEAVVGTLFLEKGQPASQAIWDARIPSTLIAGEVNDETVDLSMVSAIDGITIGGRTIASEFQWQESLSTTPASDPNDISPFRPGGRDDLDDFGGRGRFGDGIGGLFLV